MQNSPIVIVEDDIDDCEMLLHVFREIGVSNEFKCFPSPISAIEYLRNTTQTPFIIISDINMPLMDGLSFKKVINEDSVISRKRIPFVFLSTSRENRLMAAAFNLSIQGYFQKPNDIESLKGIARAIVEYWKHSTFHLNSIN
jgi:CheY-like chemotaxis protein